MQDGKTQANFCGECGQRLPGVAHFCTQCGARVVEYANAGAPVNSAGWYRVADGERRYWDGHTWTVSEDEYWAAQGGGQQPPPTAGSSSRSQGAAQPANGGSMNSTQFEQTWRDFSARGDQLARDLGVPLPALAVIVATLGCLLLLALLTVGGSSAGTSASGATGDSSGTSSSNYSPYADVRLLLEPECANMFTYSGVYPGAGEKSVQEFADLMYGMTFTNGSGGDSASREEFIAELHSLPQSGFWQTGCMGEYETLFYDALLWRWDQRNG